jgi:hypothetical protein
VARHLILLPITIIEPAILIIELSFAVAHAVDFFALVPGALLEGFYDEGFVLAAGLFGGAAGLVGGGLEGDWVGEEAGRGGGWGMRECGHLRLRVYLVYWVDDETTDDRVTVGL